ncbi:MAG: hypothetical protein Q7U94_09400 [Sideroxyarcus sp.]|nr:hypothetical protein [Sideroxyarcus sp.]
MSLQREMEDRVLTAVSQFASSLTSGRKVVADMSALVEATSRLPLSNLGNWERLIRTGLHLASANSKPAKWKFWARPAPFLTWIDLCSGDGFKRERTLRILSGAAPNRFFLAMAARRLNDWVPQVRSAARDQLPSIAVASNPEDVVDVLCAVFPHWSSWGRMDTEGKQALLRIASIEAVTHSLKSRLVSATAGPLASVLAQAGQTPVLDADFPEIASSAIQPSVRAKAYKFLLDGKVVWLAGRKWEWTDIRYCKGYLKPMLCDRPLSVKIPLEETLRAASVDRSAIVRRVAADVLIRESGTISSVAFQMATMLASDSHPAVAARGRFALKKLSQMGPGA